MTHAAVSMVTKSTHLCTVRTCPGFSYLSLVERIESLLNIVLSDCVIERDHMSAVDDQTMEIKDKKFANIIPATTIEVNDLLKTIDPTYSSKIT